MAKNPDKISIYQTSTSTTNGQKTTSRTPRPAPGSAWVKGTGKDKNFWVKPANKSGEAIWDDNKGWVTKAAQAVNYDIPLAIINSDPELKALFDEAWLAQKNGQEFTQENFTTRLQSLNWFKTKSEAQRKYYTLSRDPAQASEFAKQIGNSRASVQDAAGLLGVSLTDAQADELARTSLQNGLNPSELNNLISGYISYSGQTDEEKIGSLFGAAGEAEDQIRDWAKKNNVTVANDWVLNQVRGIASQSFDVNKSKDYITNIAKQQYSAWADKLDNFNSVEDLSAGYRQLIATELKENVDNIDLKNVHLDAAMKATDDKGKPIGLQVVAKNLRKLDQWADVNKDKVYGAANSILSVFGMR
jgi:hypothetical protein